MKAAANLVLVGPMGAGKSVVGRRLAGRLGLAFVDLDTAIEQATGASIAELFASEGEAAFREHERRLLAGLLAREGQLIATGGGAVLDARSRELLRERSFVAWLRIGIDKQLRRLADCDARPLLQGSDREGRLRALAAVRDPLYAEIADLVLDTDDDPPGQVTSTLERLLPLRWQREGNAAA
jgi:shikimate kinase